MKIYVLKEWSDGKWWIVAAYVSEKRAYNDGEFYSTCGYIEKGWRVDTFTP